MLNLNEVPVSYYLDLVLVFMRIIVLLESVIDF